MAGKGTIRAPLKIFDKMNWSGSTFCGVINDQLGKPVFQSFGLLELEYNSPLIKKIRPVVLLRKYHPKTLYSAFGPDYPSKPLWVVREEVRKLVNRYWFHLYGSLETRLGPEELEHISQTFAELAIDVLLAYQRKKPIHGTIVRWKKAPDEDADRYGF